MEDEEIQKASTRDEEMMCDVSAFGPPLMTSSNEDPGLKHHMVMNKCVKSYIYKCCTS